MKRQTYLFLAILSVLFIFVVFGITECQNNQHNQTLQELKDKSDSLKLSEAKNLEFAKELQKKDSLLAHKDTIIVEKWKIKRDSVFVYSLPQFTEFYNSILNTPVYVYDSLVCFDTLQLATVTTEIFKGYECAERLTNCFERLELKDSIIAYKDSAYAACAIRAESVHKSNKRLKILIRIWQGITAVVGIIAIAK